MFLKLMGAMPGYIYAQDRAGIFVNLFVGSTARIQLAGQTVVLKQSTGYPWQGEVRLIVTPAKPSEFDLHIRIPGWCQGPSSPDDLYRCANRPVEGAARLEVNGQAVQSPEIIRGYAKLHRRWKSGDVVQVKFDMPVQRVNANSHVEVDKSHISLMRGPVVYCFEGTDNGGAVQNLVIPPGPVFAPEYRSDLLGGVTLLHATATGVFRTPAHNIVAVPFLVTAVPYYANANRGTCQMQVWMPEHQEGSKPQNQE
jgi:DUF1680 family protein